MRVKEGSESGYRCRVVRRCNEDGVGCSRNVGRNPWSVTVAMLTNDRWEALGRWCWREMEASSVDVKGKGSWYVV